MSINFIEFLCITDLQFVVNRRQIKLQFNVSATFQQYARVQQNVDIFYFRLQSIASQIKW